MVAIQSQDLKIGRVLGKTPDDWQGPGNNTVTVEHATDNDDK